jgi:hypothetical protein
VVDVWYNGITQAGTAALLRGKLVFIIPKVNAWPLHNSFSRRQKTLKQL